MIQKNAAALLELAMISDQLHAREFVDTVIELYRYETEIGAITYEEFQTLVGDGQRGEDRLNRLMVRDEAESFAAYLHAVRRNRQLCSRLIQKFREETGE